MSKSSFLNQYLVLVWKNSVLKVREPFSTLVEILVPIGIIYILSLARHFNLKFNMEQCFLREKYMDSLGPILFLRDYLCRGNTTCFDKTQINWNRTQKTHEFLIFLNNITIVYESFPKNNLTFSKVIKWALTHPKEVKILNYTIAYLTKLSLPFLSNFQMILSTNTSTQIKGIQGLSSIICGSDINDIHMFIKHFEEQGQSRVKRNIASCGDILRHHLKMGVVGEKLYEIIAPIIFGNIFYTPHSNFTEELMSKANYSFVILDKLRLASIEWRLHFKDWLLEEFINGTIFENIRMVSKSCRHSTDPQLAEICTLINDVLNTTTIPSVINNVSLLLSYVEKVLNCVNLNKFIPLRSEEDLQDLRFKYDEDIFAGIVLDSSFQYLTRENATFLNYAIRMTRNRIDSTKNYKVLDKFWTPAPRTNTEQDLRYYTSGFLMLQEAIDRAFIEMVTDNGTVDIGSSIQIMPHPCYVEDKFIILSSNIMPFLFVIAWSPAFSLLVKSIVFEKEERLKEFMLVMGLSHLIHWLAWFTIAMLTMLIPILLTTIILKYAEILEYSSFGILILLLFSYCSSFICQAFMVSTFFDAANVAAAVSALIYFFFYIPFIVLKKLEHDVVNVVHILTGTLSQVSFSNSIHFINSWEQAKEGAQFSNFFESTNVNMDFGVGHCIIMLWIDCFIYIVITWYVEVVFPGQYGNSRPWHFCINYHYWFPKEIKNFSDEFQPKTNEVSVDFERIPENLKVGISIQNLTKIFDKGALPAVDHLNLDFYKSQITAFLGHNGAGKTTTISILTGMFTPTFGTAYLLNMDIRKNIDEIRKFIGLCPQHNILFDNLTVKDHVYFYGFLRGMSLKDIKKALPIIVEDVGLSEKINVRSKKLSGGMKRKLSVAMAFIGNSSIIFLDEPTAGVDPYARRGILDLILKYRGSEKTIILTTHYMDEADYLSDRIVIISQGKLKCCGSSDFLKKKFGDGYYLHLVRDLNRKETDNKDNDISINSENILNFIKKYIQNAKLVEETGTQCTFTLPLDSLEEKGFSNLFSDLDENLERFNISSYGISDTSLEKVFLKVAKDPVTIDQTEIQIDSSKIINNEIFFAPPNISKNEKVSKSLIWENQESNLNYNLLSGLPLLGQQFFALQIKRFHYTKRNIKGFFSELILPILMMIFVLTLLKSINPVHDEPSMIIHPWLMMTKAKGINLNTFFSVEEENDIKIVNITNIFQSDLGESGVRCMNKFIFSFKNLPCYSTIGNEWLNGPKELVSLQSPPCDCSEKGYQICKNPISGGPACSFRIMASTDILNNLTGYNISDHLIKRFSTYSRKQYGGFQFIFPSYFGLSTKIIGNSSFWGILHEYIIESEIYNENSEVIYFLNYLQQFFILSGLRTNFTRVWVNTKGYVSMPAYVNILDNTLLRSRLNASRNPNDYGIVISTYPFIFLKRSDIRKMLTIKMFLEVSMSQFVILILSLIPASFVLFLIEERVSGSKRQQFISGVNPYVYWISIFLWDILKYFTSIFFIVLIFLAYNYETYVGTKNIFCFIVLLAFYGFAIIPHMYPFSFIISTPSTAFVVLFVYNIFVGTITTTIAFLLDEFQSKEPSLIPINNVLKRLFLIFPQYGLGRGLTELSFNYIKYNISKGHVDYGPFQWDITGKILFSFTILFVFWSSVIIIIESGIINRKFFNKIKKLKSNKKEILYKEDRDVALERNRIEKDTENDDILRVIDLTKDYNRLFDIICEFCPKRVGGSIVTDEHQYAVNNICFGVKAGECFGLLGMNGAGKTTTFKMLTGEELITKGDVMINGKSIIENMVDAHKKMGFCPQFDALHALLTCKEELFFYCRIRGIRPSLIEICVQSSLDNLSLDPYARKTTQTLSGGNKRKLSTAISLIGNPQVIFMDEPTAGMDAGARRFLWNRIKNITHEKSCVVLTSHNMEECEVLCHRLAIMINGTFRCLGSVQQLKSKFSDDYLVSLRMNSNCDVNGDREKVKRIMIEEFENGVVLEDENRIILQYKIDTSKYKLNIIFRLLENLKVKGDIHEYSVYQTTLDDIFINFAKKENIQNN